MLLNLTKTLPSTILRIMVYELCVSVCVCECVQTLNVDYVCGGSCVCVHVGLGVG